MQSKKIKNSYRTCREELADTIVRETLKFPMGHVARVSYTGLSNWDFHILSKCMVHRGKGNKTFKKWG